MKLLKLCGNHIKFLHSVCSLSRNMGGRLVSVNQIQHGCSIILFQTEMRMKCQTLSSQASIKLLLQFSVCHVSVSMFSIIFCIFQDLQKKCEQNVADHKLYKDKAKDCAQWLAKAKDKFANNADTSGTRQEVEERLERIQVVFVVGQIYRFKRWMIYCYSSVYPGSLQHCS